MKRWAFLFAGAIGASTLFAAAAPELHVIRSGGFTAPFDDLAPRFEQATGIHIVSASGSSQGTGPGTIGAQLRRGAPADVVIMSKEGLEELVSEGRIVPNTAVDLAQAPLGLAVREGAPKPDIATVESFKRTLLKAKSITFPLSTTGMWMNEKLFPRLGIAAEMKSKYVAGGAPAVAAGTAELTLQPVGEILHLKGVSFVGTLPADVQFISVFSAAVVAGTQQLDPARRLVVYLASPDAAVAIKHSGMEPLGRQSGGSLKYRRDK